MNESDQKPDPKRARRQAVQTSGPPDALPPHSDEAEAGVLGCCMLDPVALRSAVGRLGDRDEAFYDLRHQTIYRALRIMLLEGVAVDAVTLGSRLQTTGRLEEAGGQAYVYTLPDKTPSAGMLEFYLTIVLENLVLRLLRGWSVQVAQGVDGHTGTVAGLIEDTRAKFEEVDKLTHAGSAEPRFFKRPVDFEEAYFKYSFGDPIDMPGHVLPTDFHWRIRRGESTCISGDDGSGKSTALLWWALHLAQAGEKVFVASFETPGGLTLSMMRSMLLGVGRQPDSEFGRREAVRVLAWLQQRFAIYDFIGIGDVRELMATFELAAARHGYTVFIIDSVMRIGIADDDYAAQGLAGARFAQFAQDHQVHLFYVLHENKGKDKGKEKIRGSKLWTANAWNIVRVERNVAKGAKLATAEVELEELRKQPELNAAEVKDQEDAVAKARKQWDTHFILQKQRWPGSRQNASRFVWFDPPTLQFRLQWDYAPVKLLDQWTKNTPAIAAPFIEPPPGEHWAEPPEEKDDLP